MPIYVYRTWFLYKQSMKLKIMSSCSSIWIMNSYVLFFIYLVCVVAPKFLVFGLCFSFSFSFSFFFLKSQAYQFRNHIQGNKYYLLFWLLSASNVLALKIWYSQFFLSCRELQKITALQICNFQKFIVMQMGNLLESAWYCPSNFIAKKLKKEMHILWITLIHHACKYILK